MANRTRQRINWADVEWAAVNNQENYQGAGPFDTGAQPRQVYFVSFAEGTDVTVKDKDGSVVGVYDRFNGRFPIRLDGGFSATSGAPFALSFFHIDVHQDVTP